MKKQIELLAPGGEIESIKAAIAAGADAVYCGLNKFNARNRAENIMFDDLQGILRLAHKNDCQVFLTLNIIILESEIPDLLRLLNKLVNTGIDGVIIQDLGLLYILSEYFKSLKIHASTQLTTHNEGQVKFMSELTATRVNLSRELSLSEIKVLTTSAHQHKVETEVFVHGSNCISFSGICYMSSLQSGNSGNQGRCSQPCRDEYIRTPAGKSFPLNLKDNSAYFDLMEIAGAGVDSIKIEGRIKKYHYVYTVVDTYRKQLQAIYEKGKLNNDNSPLYKVFNRDFSNTFLKGEINKDMFIDNPRDNSSTHLARLRGSNSAESIEKAEMDLYEEKAGIRAIVKSKTDRLSIEKAPLSITVSGRAGAPLAVAIKTPDSDFVVHSEINLATQGTLPLGYKMLLKRLKAINDTEYFIEHIDMENLRGELFIPFKELSSIKKQILFILNNSRETFAPVAVSAIKKQSTDTIKPILSVLISSQSDLALCHETTAEIYFQLPGGLHNKLSEMVDMFSNNTGLIPWFPSVFIGKDFDAAVEFLDRVKPKRIISNNTGIAFEAYQKGISWIAGPYLNIVNSYSLICLKEKFNCAGGFISNEINNYQISCIKPPDDFKLYYSIYHPILLMTTRQCLFHQVTGCKKDSVDETCIPLCRKSATITNLKKNSYFIEKSEGNYHRIFNETNFLNTEIATDLPNRFFSFLIDLRDIETNTKIKIDKSNIIKLFENHLNGDSGSAQKLKQIIYPSTMAQYERGL